MAVESKDNPDAACLPLGHMQLHTHSQPRKMIQTKDLIVIIYEANAGVRQIFLDGRPAPNNDPQPWWFGYSRGGWEDDTLVVETVQVQMPYTYFHGAPSFSEEAHYFERIRSDGERIVTEWRVEDPVTLTAPYTATITLLRDEGFDRMVQMDFSNDRTGNEDGVNTIEPPVDEETGE